jgi:lysyl-tRNA synthetase class 1
VEAWDGEYGVTYRCESCDNHETVDLRTSSVAKLLWRVDWPMRWAAEGVDFEPAGKDHHSEGGSFDTGRRIVKEVFDAEPPVSFQYDFIGIKGRGGKISSSSGEVVSLSDVLEIYQPEVVRYLFAGTRPNSEFAISFDLDVLKIYEDYDRTERIAFGVEEVSEKRRAKERRIYELSQVDAMPDRMPLQVRFRHLCSLLQIQEGNIEAVMSQLQAEDPGADLTSTRVRARCAWNWIRTFAPESFRFSLRPEDAEPLPLTDRERELAAAFWSGVVETSEGRDEKEVGQAIYDLAREKGVEPKELFALVYRILIGKETGPRLAGFLITVGRERAGARFRPYL